MQSTSQYHTTLKRESNQTSYYDGTREHLYISLGGFEATDEEYEAVEQARGTEYNVEEIQATQREAERGPFRLMR